MEFMCGIIGFAGYENAPQTLLNGLSQLEYRGYDSAGIACFSDGIIQVLKSVGKVDSLRQKLPPNLVSSCGIGHTRWATHGSVSTVNAHPHTFGRVTLIHNGIIENYHELELTLKQQGKLPVSETDSEIAAILLDSLYQKDAYAAIREATAQFLGSYAFCILFSDQPETIYCIRKGSPLVCCCCEEGSVVASDMVALLQYSKDYFVLPELQIAKVTRTSIVVTDLEGKECVPKLLSVTWDLSSAQKNGFKHYMLKEIHEQPESLRRTLLPRLREAERNPSLLLPDFKEDKISDSLFFGVKRIIITACGTAMHAGLIGRILLERLLRIPVSVEIASEFRYEDPILDESTLVITVSQSGETADTLAALRLAKNSGARTLSIVNVKGSSIARESNAVFYTHAGPEIAVASTKAYTAQLAAFYLIAFRFAYLNGCQTKSECSELCSKLFHIIPSIDEMLTLKNKIKDISRNLVCAKDLFFIGRGLDYALSCEGSIKLKEITYIHSESYAAGELKHGTLSLVTEGVPVIALATQPDVFPKMISNIKEVRARGAFVICITTQEAVIDPTLYDHKLTLPPIDPMFTPFCSAVLLQLLAYYTSLLRGLDVDQPRNLAKSVTVE